MPTELNRVQQLDANGCVVAALAMITGFPYELVRSDIQKFCGRFVDGTWITGNDFKDGGLALDHHAIHYLSERGFAVQRLYRCDPATNQNREKWPVFWARVNKRFRGYIASVNLHNNQHAIVVKSDGTVLDPYREGNFQMSDYEGCQMILAVYDEREIRDAD